MLVALWREAGGHAEQEAWLRAQKFLDRVGAARIATERGIIAATPPSRIEARPDGGVVWSHRGIPGPWSNNDAGPEIHLGREGLRIAAGPVPQYPLYYYDPGDRSLLLACSQLRPLREIVPHTITLHVDRIIELASWQAPLEPRATAFRPLQRLLPCDSIEVDDRGPRLCVSVPHADPEAASEDIERLASGFRERMEAAVARAIGDAKRVAVFAGGGLDSSGVLALAIARARIIRECSVDALAEVWASPGDDGPYLEALERHLGITAERIPARSAGSWLVRSLCMDDQPQSFFAASLDLRLLEIAAERGAQVCLAGHSGDALSGGPLSFAPSVLGGHPVRAVRAALELEFPWHASPGHRLLHWIAGPLLVPVTPRPLRRAWRVRRSRRPWMRPRFVERLEACASVRPGRIPRGPDERLTQFLTQPFLVESASYWGQLESVVPIAVTDVFRDLPLARFVGALDPLQLSADHRYRGLYRRAMRGLIPESIRLRSDKAQGEPAHAEAILAARAEPTLRDLSSLAALADAGLVEPGPFRPLFESWLSAVRRGERTTDDPADESWHTVWQLLSVETFLRAQAR
jgi:asparagine synthase (glutamine-hydrolysing)